MMLPWLSTDFETVKVYEGINEGIPVEPTDTKWIICYSGFSNDLILLYYDSLIEKAYISSASSYMDESIEKNEISLEKNKYNQVEMIVNLNPFNKITIEIKKEYNFIFIIKNDSSYTITYTNDILWFEY